MIKLLVVDDEDLIRKALLSRLRKRNYPFEEIYEASSGEEALSIIDKKKPDLVITDVKMYDISGLDLLHLCQESDYCPKFIIISGYAEFDFVQDSINNGAYGYLLKPLTNEKLFEIMDKVLATFTKTETAQSVKALPEADTKVKLNYLCSRCAMNTLSPKEYQEFTMLMNGTPASIYVVGVTYLSRYSLDRFQSFEDAYQNFADFLSSIPEFQVTVLNGRTQFNRYLIFHTENSCSLVEKICQKLAPYFRKMEIFESTLTMGLSLPTSHIQSSSFSEAESSLNQRFFKGNGKIFCSQDLPSARSKEELQADFKALETDLKYQNLTDIRSKLVTYISDSQYLNGRIDYLIYNIYILLVRLGFSLDESRWRKILEQKSWTVCENKQAIIKYLENEITLVLSGNSSASDTHDRTSYIEDAKYYIRNHYEDDLTLNSIAQQFHLNPRYFSTLFKKAEGIGPIEFLTKIRIEEAKRLLQNTDLPASEIASAIGIDDPRYFYRVFKKYTGTTPTAFRQRQTDLKENNT